MDVRAVAASVFGFVLDGLDPATRALMLDDFEVIIGNRFHGLSADAAETQLLILASKGKFRLDDATLLRRLDLETKSILAIDVPLCAQLARGELQFGKISPAMTALMTPLAPQEQIEEAGIIVASVRAEVTGTGEPKAFPKDQTTNLLRVVLKTFAPAEAARLATLASDVASGRSADSDVCEADRIVYRAAPHLSPADRLLLARYILGT